MSRPLIVQSDKTILVEVRHPTYIEARDGLSRFAELVKSPEHIHTYRLTPLSLWNAAASGLSTVEIIEFLHEYSRYRVPESIVRDIDEYMSRYGQLQLYREGDMLVLRAEDPLLIEQVLRNRHARPCVDRLISSEAVSIFEQSRGHLKQRLIKMGFPVEDLAGYVEGEPHSIQLRDKALTGKPFALRDFQKEAVDIFHAGGGREGGSGVVVLPCGAGKTMVGMGVMERLCCKTLILSTNIAAVRQWIDELLDKTELSADEIGEYTGEKKEIRPVTITTYQILTYRPDKKAGFPHFRIFDALKWGLLIYDEVHLLPAPVFRITADIQSTRRLGLTATLVREDGKEDDVFSLIGPKKYDVPWGDLERRGWIAAARCTEVRVNLRHEDRLRYAVASDHNKFRIASENHEKLAVVEALAERHSGHQVLIIGQYLRQLGVIAARLKAPLITGKVPNEERIDLYSRFRKKEIGVLVVSKVANFAIDLPDANVAIQVSGTFGSRQEEAQRLGRILRPKSDGGVAHFYSIITRSTRDQEFGTKRQLFLTEQGYSYQILNADEVISGDKETSS